MTDSTRQTSPSDSQPSPRSTGWRSLHLRIGRPHLPGRPSLAGVAVSIVALALSTLLAAILQGSLGVPDAAIVYLLAVVAVGMIYGSWYAVAVAAASFGLYDLLFIQPLYTFAVASPEEWLDLVLFLVVAVSIGRMSALQLQRRREAEFRTAEARAMFAMSRDAATAASALEAAPLLTSRLVREAGMSRVWIGLGASLAEERPIADTSPSEARPAIVSRWVLHTSAGDAQPSWAMVRDLSTSSRRTGPRRFFSDPEPPDSPIVFRVPIETAGERLGSLWATRRPGEPFPGRSHTRLLAAAADQLAQSVVRDRLASQATAAEIARQGDALKSALLDSVSHDLRTPLAAIRATAGNLMDPDVPWTAEGQRVAAEAIDREAERLSKLVRNMLDLGRIQGGALQPSLELYELADLVEPVVERLESGFEPGTLQVDVPADLPAVKVDAIFLDQILTNLLDNASRYARGKKVAVSARRAGDYVQVVVEDAGPGVPPGELSRIFERFYRAPRRLGARAETGTGIGLTVARGLAVAMGGSTAARRSSLGGLAVVVRLRCEAAEPEAAQGAVESSPAELVESSPAELVESSPAELVESVDSKTGAADG